MQHCHFFVGRKKRYCRMTVAKGKRYCGEHSGTVDHGDETQDSECSERIQCPYDPKHTCFLHKLDKHLKKCNARLKETPPYIVVGVNKGETGSIHNKRIFSDIPDDELLYIIQKIRNIAKGLNFQVTKESRSHNVVQKELQREDYGARARKHLVQNSSLLGHIENLSLLKDDTCYIEFGAGKGQLSHWLKHAITDHQNSSILLIDRESHRHKFDKRNDESGGQIYVRLRADIADLILYKIPTVLKHQYVVSVSKHLCGAATDFTLRCLMSCVNDKNNIKLNISGIIIATCCHHRCDWESYVGKHFLEENEISSDMFDIMLAITSWATCGFGINKAEDATDINNFSRFERLNISKEEGELIGRDAKLILDYGRIKYLQRCGLHAYQLEYVDKSFSPENMAIIACSKNTL